ncbi:ABC transporter permease [Methanobacterium alcaliphilum]|uniref:ABC transporter permease n=1 Tax=Methanobacterium alcaliphilum TaxID=392018 RepID=UPI00200B5448|nr:ABC transporter permease [Methanobacterium alcaliphilum]MCK9151092.1 ABC transporter permease [Methanobacterium alcaliphilum]
MKILTLARKEGQDILSNKIYLLVMFVQLLIILGAFGLAIVSSVVTDSDLMDEWGGSTALKVGVLQEINGTSLEKALNSQNLNLIYYDTLNNAKRQVGSEIVALVYISNSKGDIAVQIDNSNVFYPAVSEKISKALESYRLDERLSKEGFSQTQINVIQNPINLNEIKVNENSAVPLALDSSYFVEIMYGFIVPFILLLPFFLASNIVTDSIVGERERKTFEVLLMTPMSAPMVIIGKILPILIFSLIQSAAWILLLNALKVPIFHSLLILVLLFFVGLGFIGLGVLISMLVDSTKEANSAITLMLFFATFILFVPLFMNIPQLQGILNIIPTVLMVRMASTPTLQLDLILGFLPSILLSLGIFALSVRFFKQEGAIRL